MSLMKTLAKVAVGVAVAKGASSMMKRGQQGGGSGLGGLLGGLTGGAPQQARAGGGLEDMLGGLLGGGTGSTGGIGGLLEGLAGGGQRSGAQQSGGLQDMLGGLASGAGAGGLLGGLAQSLGQKRPASSSASFGQVLNSAFEANPEPAITPSADQEAAAALMLRAMIQAAKSDGHLDDDEQEKLMGQLGGDIDADEADFMRAQMAAPVDVGALVADVPRGMGPQVYAMSVLAIDLDSQAEAKYLDGLANGLRMDAAAVNDIHAQLGVPPLYT